MKTFFAAQKFGKDGQQSFAPKNLPAPTSMQ